jgi:hypothetical protein
MMAVELDFRQFSELRIEASEASKSVSPIVFRLVHRGISLIANRHRD